MSVLETSKDLKDYIVKRYDLTPEDIVNMYNNFLIKDDKKLLRVDK